MAKQVQKVRSRTAAWLMVVAIMVLAGVSVGQVASAGTSGGKGTTTTTHGGKGTTTTTHGGKGTTTTTKATTTTGATTTTEATTTTGATTTTRAGGQLPFTGAASLPMLFGGLALLGLGAASLLAASRRRRA